MLHNNRRIDLVWQISGFPPAKRHSTDKANNTDMAGRMDAQGPNKGEKEDRKQTQYTVCMYVLSVTTCGRE